ncbi:MAG: hypothetical protein ACRD0D_09210 [Acidimicrobiales bacterium]
MEVALNLSYRATTPQVTHLFVGSSAALLVMAAVTIRTGHPVPYPLVCPVLAHLFAMAPDLAFTAWPHERWMDVFLGRISTHNVPGRNLTWYVVFLAALALYLATVDRCPEQ